jgi:hypothetical protein
MNILIKEYLNYFDGYWRHTLYQVLPPPALSSPLGLAEAAWFINDG